MDPIFPESRIRLKPLEAVIEAAPSQYSEQDDDSGENTSQSSAVDVDDDDSEWRASEEPEDPNYQLEESDPEDDRVATQGDYAAGASAPVPPPTPQRRERQQDKVWMSEGVWQELGRPVGQPDFGLIHVNGELLVEGGLVHEGQQFPAMGLTWERVVKEPINVTGTLVYPPSTARQINYDLAQMNRGQRATITTQQATIVDERRQKEEQTARAVAAEDQLEQREAEVKRLQQAGEEKDGILALFADEAEQQIALIRRLKRDQI